MGRLRVFGRTELIGLARHTPALRFLPERRFRLLAYLAMRAQWVERDELATLFWPDRTQEAARSNLRKLLLEVRALEIAGIESDRFAVRWLLPTDAAEFEEALARGDVDAAVASYRAPVLPGIDGGESDAFRVWLAQQRTRLHAAWRDAIVTTLAHRPPAQAASLAQALLREDPLDEDALVGALVAHLGSNDFTGARELFRAYVARLADELGVEPSARVRALAAQFEAPAEAALPHPGSPLDLFGRAHELREIGALLRDSACRALTVSGPGGIGKSRLAKHAARDIAATYADGVAWIPLADLDDAGEVMPRLASELALDVAAGQDPLECCSAHLRSRRMLLVLDNADHLPALASSIDRLIAAAPHMQVLATSRTPVGIKGERILALRGLPMPAPQASAREILACHAVQMFAAHACAADPRFDAARNAAEMARLVRTVEGLPLAIQLAASWVRLMPMAEIAAEIEQSLDVLERAEEGEERAEHRSIRTTLEQSWRLLVPAEQRALAALGVLAGEFDRAAALAVTGAPLVILSSLVDKSLVHAETMQGTTVRFHLHPLLRHFVHGKATPAQRRAARDRHASYFAQWLRDVEEDLRGPGQPQALASLESRLPDCRAAWTHGVAALDERFVERATLALMYYYEARGRREEGIAAFAAAERAFDKASAAVAARAMLARALSTLHYRNGDVAVTADVAMRGVALARSAGARAALKGCLLNLGLAQSQRRQLAEARECFQEALALARDDQDQGGIAAFTSSLAMIEQDLGDEAAAETHYRETLELYRATGNARGVLTALNNLALLLLAQQRAQEALPLYEEGLQLCARHGITVMRANFLFGLGGTRLAAGQLPAARDLTLQALAAAEASGEPHVAVESRMQLARVALAANEPSDAGQAAQDALAHATRLENLPLLLDAVNCVAECRLEAGDARGAVALWLFLASRAEATEAERARSGRIAREVALTPADRAWAEAQAQRYELRNLADTLAAPHASAGRG
jgi:predicted ATPase/DNA-binding SARP family transcriptional activator